MSQSREMHDGNGWGANEDTSTTRKSIITYAYSMKLHDTVHTEVQRTEEVLRFRVLSTEIQRTEEVLRFRVLSTEVQRMEVSAEVVLSFRVLR